MPRTPKLIKPPKLVRGDCVGVVAPAGPVDPDALEQGLEVIRSMGFHPVLGDHVLEKDRFLAGSDEDRAQDFMGMIANPEIRAIFVARGGYGVNRILPLLKPARIRANPKVIVGSSDLTLLLIYLKQKCSLVSFHGPMVAGSFGCRPMRLSKNQFRKILTGAEDAGLRIATKARVIHPGKARGTLVGGCLTLLCRSLGTPYEIKTDGGLLLIEDVNEPPYRIDGMLWQLKQAGKFKRVKGVLLGEMIQCRFPKGQKGHLDQIFKEVLADYDIPVLSNCPIGHGNEIWTLPIGSEAELDTRARTLRLTAPCLT